MSSNVTLLNNLVRILRDAEEAARVQEQGGNEGDADAIRRDAIRRVLELAEGTWIKGELVSVSNQDRDPAMRQDEA